MFKTKLLTAILAASTFAPAYADITDQVKSATGPSAQEQRAKKTAELPTCTRVLGTIAIAQPERNFWSNSGLQSPEALLKMYVAKSGCFKLLDRGRGFAISQQERALAANGDLRQDSNVGKGQVTTADFILTPDVVASNTKQKGGGLMSFLGAFIPIPGAGMIASQISLNESSADVTLEITDTRSSEQVAMTEGKAEKTDLSFGAGGGFLASGGVGISSYATTAVGQVTALAYLDAYTQMIKQMGGLETPTATPAK